MGGYLGCLGCSLLRVGVGGWFYWFGDWFVGFTGGWWVWFGVCEFWLGCCLMFCFWVAVVCCFVLMILCLLLCLFGLGGLCGRVLLMVLV